MKEVCIKSPLLRNYGSLSKLKSLIVSWDQFQFHSNAAILPVEWYSLREMSRILLAIALCFNLTFVINFVNFQVSTLLINFDDIQITGKMHFNNVFETLVFQILFRLNRIFIFKNEFYTKKSILVSTLLFLQLTKTNVNISSLTYTIPWV